MKRTTVVGILLLFIAAVNAPAQHGPAAKRAVKFSSVYTNLRTQCASGLTRREEKRAEEAGQDIPSVCKGYGGYEIFIASDGATTQLQVRVKSRKQEKDVVAMETMHIADPVHTRRVEWRLADGVPFAVIFRRELNESDDPTVRTKTGEVLRVLGLKVEGIDFEVDVKGRNPNAEARRLADEAYSKQAAAH